MNSRSFAISDTSLAADLITPREGRGHRESRATAGLVNHNQILAKQRERSSRRQQTIQRRQGEEGGVVETSSARSTNMERTSQSAPYMPEGHLELDPSLEPPDSNWITDNLSTSTFDNPPYGFNFTRDVSYSTPQYQQPSAVTREDESNQSVMIDQASNSLPALPRIQISNDLLVPEPVLQPRSTTALPQGFGAELSTRPLVTTTHANAPPHTQNVPVFHQISLRDAAQGENGMDNPSSDPATQMVQESRKRSAEEVAELQKTSEKKPRKSRSAKVLGDGPLRRAVEAAYLHARAIVSTQCGFPDPQVTKGDTSWKIASAAYSAACNELEDDDVDMSEVPEQLGDDEFKLIRDRTSQLRGEIKDTAVNNLRTYHKFLTLADEPKGANGQRLTMDEIKNLNKELYASLISPEERPRFLVADSANVDDTGALYRAPLIKVVIIAGWFKSGLQSLGVTHRQYFDDNGMLALPVIALAITAIKHALDRWATGTQGGSKTVVFSYDKYSEFYKGHFNSLTRWNDMSMQVAERPAQALRRDLLQAALTSAGVQSDVTEEDHAHRISDEHLAADLGISLEALGYYGGRH